jgi:hypothetical protein
MPITYAVAVDWSGNGSFTDTGDDVTNRLRTRTPVTVAYGRDQARALSPTGPGEAGFELYNGSKDYTPGNASSPLFPNVLPARPVRVQMTLASTTYTVHRGKFDDYVPSRGNEAERSVSVSAVDSYASMSKVKLSTPLYQGLSTGDAINHVLDDAGWGGGRDIDTGSTWIPWWWEEGTEAGEALTKILDSEGPPALLYVDPSTNTVVFRDRQHRIMDAASKTSQATFRSSGTDTSTAVQFTPDLTADYGWRNIVNSVTFAVPERKSVQQTTVWEADELTVIPASTLREITVSTTDPFYEASIPVEGTDFTVLSGGLSTVSLSRTSGASTTIQIIAGGSGAVLEGLRLRANSVVVVRTLQITASDSTSISVYDEQPWPNEAPWVSKYDAQAIASNIVALRKNPLIQLSVPLANSNDFAATQQLTRKLSDRVTITDTATGITGDFYIERIEHTIRGVKGAPIVGTVFGCEAVPAGLPSNPFILGTSTLNGSAVLVA